MKCPVANTKLKREKNDQKLKNGPKNVNFLNFEKCLGIVFHFVLRIYHTKKNMIPQQKMWAGCYRLLPPTQARSEFGPWQSLSRDVLGLCLYYL